MASNFVLVIDSDLRTIKIPAGMTNIGVAGDKEVTRLYFKIPRYYGGFDLSLFNISINLRRACVLTDMGFSFCSTYIFTILKIREKNMLFYERKNRIAIFAISFSFYV